MADAEWGYTERNGPATWAEKFPQAAGSRQSPVDIITSQARSDTAAKPLKLRYAPDKALKLINPGYGWKVQVDGEGSELSGGPLEGIYKLEQFHCHWGCTSDKGSEHTVDGKSYAGELHLVHWNSSKYSSFNEAAGFCDGLAVLGVFLAAGTEHSEVGKVASLLSQVLYKNDTIQFPGELDPGKLLPDEKAYWTYQGSLTTPPCTECVTWIVFKEPIEVSETQLNTFRSLRCYPKGAECSKEEGCIVNNYRPPLPLGNRELRECGSI